MALPNNNPRGGYNQGGNRSAWQNTAAQVPEIKPLAVPDQYVDEAEKVMRTHLQGNKKITTTKLRSFLALIDDIYNVENLRTESTLLPESQMKIMRLRVRVVYDAGRDKEVETFVTQAKLLSYLKGIGTSRDALIKLAHYMEALVAYHRYLGGREN